MRLTIGAKLGLGFLIMLLLVAAAGSASIITVRRLADLTAIMAQESDEVLHIRDIWENLVRTDVALERAVAASTEGEVATARFRQTELQKTVTAYLDSKRTSQSEAETPQIVVVSPLETAHQDYNEMFETYIKLAVARASPALQTFSDNKNAAMSTYLSTLAEMENKATGRMVEALDEIQRAQSSLLLLMIGFTIVAALLGAGLAVGITRSVTIPVRRIVEVADSISMGNLDTSIGVTSRDEIGELQESIERMRVSLKTAMERLKKQR